MSEENVEIARAALDAFNRRDWDSTLKDAASSFEYDLSHSIAPNRGVYPLDQVRGVFDDFVGSWASVRWSSITELVGELERYGGQLPALLPRRTTSTFSRDIAYPRRPTASIASSREPKPARCSVIRPLPTR